MKVKWFVKFLRSFLMMVKDWKRLLQNQEKHSNHLWLFEAQKSKRIFSMEINNSFISH